MTNREKLKQLLINTPTCDNDCSLCKYKYTDDKCEEHLSGIMADHLLSNGVIVLPCKVGDTVYSIDIKNSTITPHIIKKISYSENKFNYIYEEYNGYSLYFSDKDFGERVFSSKEDAVAKLKDINTEEK